MDYISRLITTEYPAVVSAFAFPVLIAVFAFALPLLLQVISRLDDKYRSTLIVKVFRMGRACRIFITNLIASLVLALIYVAQFPRCIDMGKVPNAFTEHSALFLFIISVILLIINGFRIVNWVCVFYIPDSLSKVVINRYLVLKTSKALSNKSQYFAAISQLFSYAVRNEDESLIRRIQGFYAQALSDYQDRVQSFNKSVKIKYPDYVYDGLSEVNESICRKQNASFALDCGFFYDLFLNIRYVYCCHLDDDTYRFIWRCLCRAVSYGKSQYVFAYWKSADLFLRSSMLPGRCGDAEIERFREFNYVLGGFLLMNGNFSLLNKMMFWTNQDPPSYVLLPDSSTVAIEWFMKIEANGSIPFYYDDYYPYDETGDIYSGDRLKERTKRYLSVLFLWRVATDNGVCDTKSLPWDICTIKKWKCELGVLKIMVEENLVDRKVMSMFGLSDSKCLARRSAEVICEFECRLKGIQEEHKEKMLRDNIQSFVDGARNELCAFFGDKSILFGRQSVNDAKDTVFLPMSRKMITKDDFAFDVASLGAKMAQEFEWHFINRIVFLFRHCLDCSVYRLERDSLFAAVRCMRLDANSFTVLAVGSWEDEGISTIEIAQKVDLPFVVMMRCKYRREGLTLYVVSNEDLACTLVREQSVDNVRLYDLKSYAVADRVKMYAGVSDLNENESLRYYCIKKMPDLNYKDILFASAGTELEFRFVKGHKSMAFIEFSQFSDSGYPDALEDVRSVW